MAVVVGFSSALDYAESRNYTEPPFVFVVMVVAASRPAPREPTLHKMQRRPLAGSP